MAKKYPYSDDFKLLALAKINLKNKIVLSIANTLGGVMYKLSRPNKNVSVERHTVVGEGGFTIKMDVLSPKNQSGKLPCLFYIHGGGFLVDISTNHLHYCGHYADQANCVVVMPHYRLASKDPFPGGFDDCYQTLLWTRDNAELLGIDPEKIIIGGESAGGCLAAGIAQKDRDEKAVGLKFQMLIYPALDATMQTPSMKTYTDTPLWNAVLTKTMWEIYLKGHDEIPKYASPLNIPSLEGLPPAYIEPAEFCCFKDESTMYAERLKSAGIDVALNPTEQTIHLFDIIEGSSISKAALQDRIQALKNAWLMM